MTELEKELVRFVSGYLDAGVSAEDYVKAFSQRLLDSIGRQSKPKASEGLEAEIKQYYSDNFDLINGDNPTLNIVTHIARHFAQWQKEKDERTLRKFFNDRNQGDASFYDLLAYREGHRDGMIEQKEQMMKDAVEYEVGMHGEPITINLDKYVQRARGIFPGDKVRIIIVKED